ncbi:MAG: cation:proton antiporter, partial [Phycisphaerales bacterium]
MPETILPQIAGIIVLGAAAQWLAWRAALPSILLLLLCGLIAGPVTGWLNPDELFGDLITPAVSIAVALILYEGGLTLKLSEITRVRGVVRNLVTIGALVTWFVGALAAYLIFDLSIALAALLGAVLVVTGPTVIVPLLHHIRPTGSVGAALKWEGIVIDPIGALLTVLIFEVIVIGKAGEATAHVALAVAKTVFLGGGLGVVAAGLLVLLIKRYWIPDYLQNAVSLMLVVGTFVLSNLMQEESGLLAVTVMGFALANQRWADVGEIVE